MSELFSSPYTYASIIAIAACMVAYFGSNQINKQRNKTVGYTYAAIIVTAAFIAAYGSSQINKQINKTAEQTETIVKIVDTTLGELEEASEKINFSLKEAEIANLKLKGNNQSIVENLQKTIEVKEATIKLKEEVIGLLTGGDSYPEILFKKNEGFSLRIDGEYEIPKLGLQIVHFMDFLNTPIESLALYLDDRVESGNISIIHEDFFPRTYSKNVHSIKLDIFLNNKISHGFDFIFTSEYKKWVQRIRLIPIKNKWEVLNSLEEVLTQNKDKTSISNISKIFYKVSKDYPNLIRHEGKTYGNEALFYMMDNQKRNYLNSSRLFNNGVEIEEKNSIEPLEINFFDIKK
ncbi:MAG: hypothetical protein GY870_15110 [archaeon]|nr:hypothetical protein [archaeon]